MIRSGIYVGIAAGLAANGVILIGRFETTWTMIVGSVLIGAGLGMIGRSPWQQ